MTGAEVSLAVAGMCAAVGTVSSWVRGKVSKDELHQLAVRYWGCVLFDLAHNIGVVANALDERAKGQDALPSFRFTFVDGLLAELARISPLPSVLSDAATIVQDQRTMERLVDLAISSDVIGISHTKMWEHVARGALRRHLAVYNSLRDAMNDEGRKAYGDAEWQVVEPAILPPPLDAHLVRHLMDGE
jgi:hypothetical protein